MPASAQPSVAQTPASASTASATTQPRAADISLSITTDGRLRLQVVSVNSQGAPLPATLRITVGRSSKPDTGAAVNLDASASHRVTLPGVLRPGRTYYYDLMLGTGAGSVRYPAAGRFRFRAPASTSQPLTFLAWGDSRPDGDSPTAATPSAFQLIVTHALTHRPALAVASGDLVNVAGDTSAADVDAKYTHFLAVENQLARRLPVMPSTGNHEGIWSDVGLAGWAKWYALPTSADPQGRYYSFNDGDVHFVVLSASGFGADGIGYRASRDTANSPQAKWLVSDLQHATRRWTVVVIHYPLFDPKPSDYWATSGRSERDALASLFAQNGVDLVLQGHSHFYRRHEQPVYFGGRKYWTAYVTEGAGGAPLYSVSSVPRDSHDVAAYSADGYLIFHSSGTGKLTAVAYRIDSATGAEAIGDSFSVQQIPRGAVYEP